jgi:hypothetical protein
MEEEVRCLAVITGAQVATICHVCYPRALAPAMAPECDKLSPEEQDINEHNVTPAMCSSDRS